MISCSAVRQEDEANIGAPYKASDLKMLGQRAYRVCLRGFKDVSIFHSKSVLSPQLKPPENDPSAVNILKTDTPDSLHEGFSGNHYQTKRL